MLKQHCVIGLGELLWDCFPDSRRAGGAPANFAFHARQLGADGVVVSRVGTDALGRELMQFLRQHDLDTEHVQSDGVHPTGRVDISFSPTGEPQYEFLKDAAWDHLAFDESAAKIASQASAVCFGTLAQRGEVSRAMVRQFLAATPPDCSRVFDVNLRPPWYSEEVIAASLADANIVKLNEEEVTVLANMFNVAAGAESLARFLFGNYEVNKIIVTRGAAGCMLLSTDEVIDLPAIPVSDPHPVGAGDAFTAATVCGLLSSWQLERVAVAANRVAALVASHQGAMPSIQVEMREIMSSV